MKIYDLLKKDHDKVKELMNSIEQKFDPELFEQLKTEITLHNEAEEEAFYEPLQEKAGSIKIVVKGAHEEHDLAIKMMKQLGKVKNEEERTRLFSVIKKTMEAHIEMEEEDLFELAKKHFTVKEAQEMAARMNQIKSEIKAS